MFINNITRLMIRIAIMINRKHRQIVVIQIPATTTTTTTTMLS